MSPRLNVTCFATYMLACDAARAHTPVQGIGAYFSGVLHPLVTPSHLLAVAGLGLLFGRVRGNDPARRADIGIGAFLAALLAGLLIGSVEALPPQYATLLLALAAATALIAATSLSLPAWTLSVIGLATGLVIGLDSVQEMPSRRAALVAATGTLVAMVFALVCVAGAASHARRSWHQLGLRALAGGIGICSLLLMSLSLVTGRTPFADLEAGDPVRVTIVATSYPLAYFARRLAGPDIPVILPAVPASKHFWKPTPADLTQMRDAAFVLTDNRHADHWLDHLAGPMANVIDTTAGTDGAVTDGDIEIEALRAPNPWLDQIMAVHQASAVKKALARTRQVDSHLLEARWQALESDLLATHEALRNALGPLGGRPVLVSTDGYAYLAARYDLDAWGFAWKPDAPIGDGVLGAVANLLSVHPAHWMLWHRRPSEENAGRLESLGVRSLVFDPLAEPPLDGDYLSVMQRNVDTLRKALGPPVQP